MWGEMKADWQALRQYLDQVMKKNPHEEETRMLRVSDFVDDVLATYGVETATARQKRLIKEGVLDADGNLKPYGRSAHRSTPLSAEEVDVDDLQFLGEGMDEYGSMQP